MSEYVFYKIDDEVRAELEIPDVPFPVRKEIEQAVFGGEKIDFNLLLSELEDYLSQHPEYREEYSYPVGFLCYILGINAGSEGGHRQAQRYFAKGLVYMPENTSLRANFALALQAQGKDEEALTQYRKIINDDDIEASPLLWSLASRLHAAQGNYRDALSLLGEIAPFFGDDEPGFRQIMNEFETKADHMPDDSELSSTRLPPEGPPSPPSLRNEWYYLADGKPAGPVTENELKASLAAGHLPADTLIWKDGIADWREAQSMGLVNPQKNEKTPKKTAENYCTKCGAQIKPGTKFCTRCGAPVRNPNG